MKFRKLLYLIIPMVLVTQLLSSTLPNTATNQFKVAEPLSFDTTMLSEEDWLRYGREMATAYGLVGEPRQEEKALMTYGSYLMLTGQNANSSIMPREAHVFVYQVFGNIPKLEGFGLAAGNPDIEGFIFAYDAHKGHNFASTALSKDKPGALDLSVIPADVGEIPALQTPFIPTAIPFLDPTPFVIPEATSELLPLPLIAP